jgi:hypothetical protein
VQDAVRSFSAAARLAPKRAEIHELDRDGARSSRRQPSAASQASRAPPRFGPTTSSCATSWRATRWSRTRASRSRRFTPSERRGQTAGGRRGR